MYHSLCSGTWHASAMMSEVNGTCPVSDPQSAETGTGLSR
jgi:hypothetical protein